MYSSLFVILTYCVIISFSKNGLWQKVSAFNLRVVSNLLKQTAVHCTEQFFGASGELTASEILLC